MYLFTYYFGYFKLKWRRLIRTVIFFASIYFLRIVGFEYFRFDGIVLLSFVIISHFIIFGLISWILEPFVITKKSSVFFKSEKRKFKD